MTKSPSDTKAPKRGRGALVAAAAAALATPIALALPADTAEAAQHRVVMGKDVHAVEHHRHHHHHHHHRHQARTRR
jgi:Ni/Co efflux regulator RcnB